MGGAPCALDLNIAKKSQSWCVVWNMSHAFVLSETMYSTAIVCCMPAKCFEICPGQLGSQGLTKWFRLSMFQIHLKTMRGHMGQEEYGKCDRLWAC